MSFDSELTFYQDQVNQALRDFFARQEAAARSFDASSSDAFEILREFTLRPGKRLRPILMIYGYKCCGGNQESAILHAACSLELMQSYLLIHDDVMDRSLLRRGLPTVHKTYEKKFMDLMPDAAHLSMSMAILVGDIGSHLGAIALGEAQFEPAHVARAILEYNEIARDVAFGQLLDMSLPMRAVVTANDVIKLHEAKTSRYSTEGPLRLGAILAGANEQQIEILSQFGRKLGVAFQVKDDLLGMFGTEEKIGKSTKSDLAEGKMTLLIITALRNGSERQRAIIKHSLGNQSLTDENLEEVRRTLEETGARQDSEAVALALVEEAKRSLEVGDFADGTTSFLLDLSDYLVTRER